MRIKAVMRFFVRRIQENELPQAAGSLSYTTVLSLIPLLVVALSVLTGFPVFAKFQEQIQQLMLDNLMPERMSKVVMKQITQFAEQSSRLSLIGGFSLLLTALLTMSTIDRAFNDIWRVQRTGLMRKHALVYWAVLTAGPVLFLGVLVFGSNVLDLLKNYPKIEAVVSLIIPFVGAVVGFTALYVFVPNRKVLWRHALIGGVVAASLFMVLTQSFSAIFKSFQVFAVLYSAFSVIPAFFLWLYLFWWTILLGATVAASVPILKYERWRKESRPGDDLPEALMIMYLLYQAQHSPSRMISWSTIQSELRLNSEDLANIMGVLQQHGWVAKVRRPDESTGWALICDVADVSLSELYDVFVFDSQYYAAKAEQHELPWARQLTTLHRSNYHRVSLGELFLTK